MKLSELIATRRRHAARLANRRGASGESTGLAAMEHWAPRPKGAGLKVLMLELAASGVVIRPTSFDALALPGPCDFSDQDAVRAMLPQIVFIEIKSATQARVKPGFGGFFFALTEGEIDAAEKLGERHKVALINSNTGEILLTSVADILARARSTTWQVSVQL